MKKPLLVLAVLLLGFSSWWAYDKYQWQQRRVTIGETLKKTEVKCQNVNEADFFKNFQAELDLLTTAIVENKNPEAWEDFYAWTVKLKPCTDGAYAEGIANSWERGVAYQFAGFTNFFRAHPELVRELNFEFQRVYRPDPDGVVDPKSREALLKQMAGKCPAEFRSICNKKKDKL